MVVRGAAALPGITAWALILAPAQTFLAVPGIQQKAVWFAYWSKSTLSSAYQARTTPISLVKMAALKQILQRSKSLIDPSSSVFAVFAPERRRSGRRELYEKALEMRHFRVCPYLKSPFPI